MGSVLTSLFLVAGSFVSTADDPASNAPPVLLAFREHILDALDQPATTSLFKEHILSLSSLTEITWNEVLTGDSAKMEETLNFIGEMNRGLLFDAKKPSVYFKEGKRSLVLAFTSEVDGSLQYYSCALPPKYDPSRAYPVVVDLHGHGSSNRIFYVFIHIAIPPDQEQYLQPRVTSADDVIVIRPWGRGNQGYLDAAGKDVMQSIADAKKRFKIDSSRQYLQGHSMGGFGTWRIAGETPGQWAAICICSGGAQDSEALAANLVNTPVRIWHGANDEVVKVSHAYTMQRLLQDAGAREVDLMILPDNGHNWPSHAQDLENRQWLLKHRLKK